MRRAKVVTMSGGQWGVELDGKIVWCGSSNAKAWREADKLNNEAMSRAQDASDWAFKKGASGE